MSSGQVIKLWEIIDKRLEEIRKEKLDFEKRLEDWLEADISTISPNLLVIGKQVPTDYGGYIDLLCLEEDGDIVIIELKRARAL
jgi:RecB family endonuclease NucS